METFCCYCGEAKGDKFSCCDENHFVPFNELDDDMREAISSEGDPAAIQADREIIQNAARLFAFGEQ